MASVIVFGPTGNIGSVAAVTAQEHGAKVYLAMRDPKKTIPGLSPEQEKAGGFERVQADLLNPDSVTEAIKKTGATRAFTYVAMGSQDHMKATMTALKAAGVETVVLLSSYTVHGDPHQFSPKEVIPYIHAQVEIVLDEVYGPDNYIAIRPGGFATNLMRFKDGIIKGEVRLFGSAFGFDCITAGDMGRVSGTILANGTKDGQRKVYLYGPKEWTQKGAIAEIGKALGKDIKVVDIGEEEAREQFTKAGYPPPVANYMLSILSAVTEDTPHHREKYQEGVKNVELYTGRSSMGLEEWLVSNKQLFSA